MSSADRVRVGGSPRLRGTASPAPPPAPPFPYRPSRTASAAPTEPVAPDGGPLTHPRATARHNCRMDHTPQDGAPADRTHGVCDRCGAVRTTPAAAPCERCGAVPEPVDEAPHGRPDRREQATDSGAAQGRSGRDRDVDGRARNSRPRDGLGRPLPYGAQGVERQPEGILRTPRQTLDEAQRLLDDGMPFHAHEVLEDMWKAAPTDERALWRALAQLAVGLTHAARGNSRGAAALLERAAKGLAPYGDRAPYGIDAAGLVRWVADRDTAAGPPPALRTPHSAT